MYTQNLWCPTVIQRPFPELCCNAFILLLFFFVAYVFFKAKLCNIISCMNYVYLMILPPVCYCWFWVKRSILWQNNIYYSIIFDISCILPISHNNRLFILIFIIWTYIYSGISFVSETNFWVLKSYYFICNVTSTRNMTKEEKPMRKDFTEKWQTGSKTITVQKKTWNE